jgi:hypothetical protein
MSASSINRKVAEIEKAKKVERRNAAIKRYESENNIVKHIETEVGGVSPETSSSDSVIDSGKVEEAKPKAPKAKSAGTKKRGSGKGIFSNRKATKV